LFDIREAKEREIKHELMKVLGIQNRERMRQEDLRSKIIKYETEYSEKLRKGKFAPAEAMFLMRYVDISRSAIAEAQRRIDEMQPIVDEIRGRLVIASREKKIVEKLKERKLEEYMYEFNRNIAKENDDMNQKLYQRKLM
ncbi:MAG: flagellar export protein FliJ, partial [Leptospirales bacterium]|nr:flagellar export protein FliJ [Leptospirales bacterium]